MINEAVEIEKKHIEEYIVKLIEKYFVSADLEQDGQEKTAKNVLILITRKGYWLFKHISKSKRIQNLIEERKVVFVTDRFILKESYGWVKGKNIYIFDDTITNGNNLFFFYSIFKKHGAREVIPIVYAASTEFFKKKSDESKFLQYRRAHRSTFMLEKYPEAKCEQEFKDLKKVLKYAKILTPDEVALLSIRELLWFQEGTEPMVMDLPVFRYSNRECTESIIISKEQYSKICEWNREWEFIKNTYEELDSVINCDFFQLNDLLLYEKFKNLFFNFVVKCKTHQLDDERIQIVFIPFAMIKSSDFMGTWQCFKELLYGTEYYNEVYSKIPKSDEEGNIDDSDIISYMKRNHNFCTGIYRAVVFSLSNYIAYRFQEKIHNDIGIDLYLDEEYLKNNSNSKFVNTFLQEYKQFDKETYLSKIRRSSFVNKPIRLKLNSSFVEKKEAVDINKIELYVRERILRTRYIKNTYEKGIVTIEDLEDELEERFYFNSDVEKRIYLTKILILLLELSCSGNDIRVSNENKTIYRGFKAGENSEILMAPGGKWIYPYVYAYYFYADEDFFKDNFGDFKSWVVTKFTESGYMNTIISSENLQYFLRYYEGIEKEHLYEQVMSKCYLLDDYLKKKDTVYGRFFVENAFSSVFEWGDRIYGRTY